MKGGRRDLPGSLGHVTGAGTGCGNEARAGQERCTNGDINERGDAVQIKLEVRAGMFNLIVHHTGEAWDGLLNVNLGAAVRLSDVSKASGHHSVPAVNTAAVPAPVAVVLVEIHGFATYLLRYAFIGAGWGSA